MTDWINSLAGYQSFADWQIEKFGSTTAPGAGANDNPDGDSAINFLER